MLVEIFLFLCGALLTRKTWLGKSIRLLRTDRESAIRLVLRKLHIRWWHASELTMKRFLDKVGVSQLALDNISNIVQSCPVCREWAKPGPANVGTTSAPDKFNQQVECDLLEFNHLDDKEHHRVLHLVDRCTRWQATTEVPNKGMYWVRYKAR